MKWLVAISLIVFIIVTGFVAAASSGPVLVCPVCKKPIVEGSFMTQKLVKGEQVSVHFACAYEDMMKFKWEQVKQQRKD